MALLQVMKKRKRNPRILLAAISLMVTQQLSRLMLQGQTLGLVVRVSAKQSRGAACGGFYANSLVRGAWRLSGWLLMSALLQIDRVRWISQGR